MPEGRLQRTRDSYKKDKSRLIACVLNNTHVFLPLSDKCAFCNLTRLEIEASENA